MRRFVRISLVAAPLIAAFSGLGCRPSAPIAPPWPIAEDPVEVASSEPIDPHSRGPLVAVGPDDPFGTHVGAPDPFLQAGHTPGDEACRVPLSSRLGPDCQVIFPSRVSASGSVATANNAFDGSTCTEWNAGGFAPQAITVDMGATIDVDALILVPEMLPNGAVTHRVEVSADGERFEPSQRIEAPMQSGVAVELRLPKRERVRFLRFATDASPSWVSWREIGIVRCGKATQ